MPRKQALKAASQSKKQERLEARVTRVQKLMIERAARIRGTSVTNFVLVSAQEAAAETIKDFELLTLRDKARETFVDALLHPPAPNATARGAAKRYLNRMNA
jgi:uncharacterized protein (DUF1778 family)